MKKNRPAYKLSVLADSDKIEEVEDIIFSNTTSIGIRKIPVERTILDREMINISYDNLSLKYKKNFTAIPARIIELVLAKFLLDIKYTKIIAISANPIAPIGIKFIENPRRRKKDAPKPAAEDTPRVNGDASGLSRIVCIQAPASPKISPKIRAVVISGILILKRIVL
jgi:hypothetical protein